MEGQTVLMALWIAFSNPTLIDWVGREEINTVGWSTGIFITLTA